LLITIIAFLGVSGYWAATTEIDDVTRADGRVVPSSQTQVVQSSEPGVLKKLLIKKGDVVNVGQTLMEFDRTILESQLQEALQRSYALKIRIRRLSAEVAGKKFSPDPDLIAIAPQVASSETSLSEAIIRKFHADSAILDRQHDQRIRELEDARSRIATAKKMLALVKREYDMMQPLVDQRVEPETTLISLSRKKIEFEGQISVAVAAVARVKATLEEINEKHVALTVGRLAKAQDNLSISVGQLEELKPRLDALGERVARSKVRSPVRGVVNQIMLTTIGGVTQAGQTLMEIVPMDNSLLIEAYVRPKDIAFLFPNQKVKIKITAYDFSRYGGIEGRIVRIGANAITRPGTKQQVFIVEVKASTRLYDSVGKSLDIIPGMLAQIDILSRKKRIIDYLIRPVVRVKERAFRD
jgi:adhesin transport system membrane fusion protein